MSDFLGYAVLERVAAYFAGVLCATFFRAGRSDYGVFVVVSNKSEIATFFLPAGRANAFFAALFGTGRGLIRSPVAVDMVRKRKFFALKRFSAHTALFMATSFLYAGGLFV